MRREESRAAVPTHWSRGRLALARWMGGGGACRSGGGRFAGVEAGSQSYDGGGGGGAHGTFVLRGVKQADGPEGVTQQEWGWWEDFVGPTNLVPVGSAGVNFLT